MVLSQGGLEATFTKDPFDCVVFRESIKVTHHDHKVLGLSTLINPIHYVLSLVQADYLLLHKIVKMQVNDMYPLFVWQFYLHFLSV